MNRDRYLWSVLVETDVAYVRGFASFVAAKAWADNQRSRGASVDGPTWTRQPVA